MVRRKGVKRWHWTPLSPQRRVLTVGAECSGQGETGCAGSLQSPKERCVRLRLPASAAPTVFPWRITLWPLSEVAGEALPAAGGGDREASCEEQRVVGSHCSSESIQRILWIDTELGKNCNALMNWYFCPPLCSSEQGRHSVQCYKLL